MSAAPRIPPLAPDEVIYPDSQEMPDSPTHMIAIVLLIATLREWFRPRRDVYVIGNVFWYYERGNPKARRAPDLMVIKGVDPATQRRSYKDWEGGARPCFVLEVLSEETYKEDLQEKRDLYERLGVREYFLFDPDGLAGGATLVGYRLILGRYEALPPANDGSLPSSELGLRVRPEGDVVAFLDRRTLQRLLDPQGLAEAVIEIRAELEEAAEEREEMRRELQAAQELAEQSRAQAEQSRAQAEQSRAQAEQERLAREEAQRQAEQERLAREEAQRQAEQERLAKGALEQEVERLRALVSKSS